MSHASRWTLLLTCAACSAPSQTPGTAIDSAFTFEGRTIAPASVNAYTAEKLGFTSRGGSLRCAYLPLGQSSDRIFINSLCLELLASGDSIATGSGRGGPIALRVQVQGDSAAIVSHEVPEDGGGHAASIRRIFPEGVAAVILDRTEAAPLGALERFLRATSRRGSPVGGGRELLETRVPRAVAGQPGWTHEERARADFDGDGQDESLVIISDAEMDARGRPLFSDGHRWQVYIEESDSARVYLYARFLPNGMLTARIGASGSARPTIILLEQSPSAIGLYELAYARGAASIVARLERELDVSRFPVPAVREQPRRP